MGRLAFDRSEREMPELEKLQDQHREMARLMVAGLGNKEIAEKTGYSPQMVSLVRNSTIVREHVEKLQAGRDSSAVSIAGSLRRLSPEALGVVHDLMIDPEVSSAVRLSAAKDLLDRAGHAPVRKISVGVGTLTQDRIEELKRRARAQLEAEVIDVKVDEETFEEVNFGRLEDEEERLMGGRQDCSAGTREENISFAGNDSEEENDKRENDSDDSEDSDSF